MGIEFQILNDVFCDQKCFQLEWPRHLEATHITVKELIPIVLGVAVWGREWQGR